MNVTVLYLLFTGPRYAIQIGEKMVDYNEEFRLFLSTRNPNPFIPPDAASIVTEVNFSTTGSGLRGQVSVKKEINICIPESQCRSLMVQFALIATEIFSSTQI